nr:hypothetical protein [Pontibacillus sp. HN14]
MVKIHNGIKEGKSYYEATRGNWKINRKRIEYIEYVVGINKGKVVCAFQPSKWYIVEESQESGRSFFDGSPVEENMLANLKQSQDLLVDKFGQGSAVAYALKSECRN